MTCLTCRTRLKNGLLSKHFCIHRCHVLVCGFFYGHNFTMFPVLWLTVRDVSTYCHTMKIKGKENINNKYGFKKKGWMFHWGEVQNALFWEVVSLEISKSTWLVTWETSQKKTSTSHFLSFPDLLVLPVKFAQYSFWQKTLNKAFPGSTEVIKDGYMLKCKKFRTMYCTKLLHHMYTKIWTLSCGGISEHHGIFLERKNTRPCIKVGCLRPAVTFCLSLSFFFPETDPC